MPAKGTSVLAIDAGTTGVGAFLFDKNGKAIARVEEDFPQHFPQPGWVEHDLDEIWNATRRVVAAALKQARIKPEALAAVGITNQRETVGIWDAQTSRPVHRAIVWQDRRTAAACETLVREGHADAIREKTGLLLDAYFSAPKIAWILDQVPGARKAAEAGTLRAGTVDAWILWKLTQGKVHATDFSNASRTLLLNLDKGSWDSELAALFRVPLQILPEVKASSGILGTTAREAFGAEVPIAGVAGDQQAALFGHACFDEGESKNTYGTGSFLLVNTGDKRRSAHRLLSTAAWDIGGKRTYALEGSVFVTGAAIQWLRDGLGMLSNAEETEVLARRVPNTGGVYFVPALTGLGAPHWEPNARGLLMGITRGTTKAHLARAALEAIAYQVYDVAEAFERDAGVRLATLRVDGGGARNNFLLQFQADLLGVPVERPSFTEATAQGAAFLAGLGAGIWSSQDDLRKLTAIEARFAPAMDPAARERLLAEWHEAVAMTLAMARTGARGPPPEK